MGNPDFSATSGVYACKECFAVLVARATTWCLAFGVGIASMAPGCGQVHLKWGYTGEIFKGRQPRKHLCSGVKLRNE